MAVLNKKRKKSKRMRGSHTHGRGFKKKGRGKGHRGGRGMAGTGKRGDQRKSMILLLPEPYFGKDSLNPKKRKYKELNLTQVARMAEGKKEIDLNGYKILSNGEINFPLKISAYSASKKALEKVKKAGGEITVNGKS